MNAPDIVVLRQGTEGLSTAAYADELRERLPDHGIVHARTPHEEREYVADARIATGIGLDGDLLSAAERLELFAVASSGYEHLPLDALARAGVTVVNAAGIHAPGIADQVLGCCLMFARRLHEGLSRTRRAEWRHYQAREFTDSTVTVVGLGSIGRAVVDRLQGFQVDTIGVRYTPEKGGPTDEVIGFEEAAFHDALSRTDYLVLTTPLTDVTEGLVGEAELATLEPHAVLVNVCRGGVVDTDALLGSLQKEDLRGAALDVTDPEPLPADHPLWRLENVLVTPHMGGHTPRHWERMADILAENVERLDRGEDRDLLNRVSLPEADASPGDRER